MSFRVYSGLQNTSLLRPDSSQFVAHNRLFIYYLTLYNHVWKRRYETSDTVVTVLCGFHGFHMHSGKKRAVIWNWKQSGALILKEDVSVSHVGLLMKFPETKDNVSGSLGIFDWWVGYLTAVYRLLRVRIVCDWISRYSPFFSFPLFTFVVLLTF